MSILLKFEFENIQYFVAKNSDERIVYYYIKDNIQYNCLNEEQIHLIDRVVEQITPSNNLIKLTSYKLNTINYEVYLDKKTKLRLFNPIPNIEDSIYLNNLFNNMEEFIHEKNKQYINKSMPWDKASFIKRVIKEESKFIIVYVSILFFAFNTIKIVNPQLSYQLENGLFEKSYNQIEETKKISDEEFLSRIIAAISLNKNLSNEEKDLFLSNPFVFLDNKEYMNLEYMELVLSNLSVKYVKEKNGNIAGTYSNILNTITVYNTPGFEDSDKSVLTHEFLHALTQYYLNEDLSFFVETTNNIFNNEYMKYEANVYNYYAKYTKALMEIIGSEPLKKYHNYSRLDYIINPLCEIINDREKAEKLIYNLDNYKKIYDKGDYENQKDNLANLQKEIYGEINEYYYKKAGLSIEDDLVMLYYLNEALFIEKVCDYYNISRENLSIQEGITYFNSDKYSDYIMMISTMNNEEDSKFFLITPENRYINKNGVNYSNIIL